MELSKSIFDTGSSCHNCVVMFLFNIMSILSYVPDGFGTGIIVGLRSAYLLLGDVTRTSIYNVVF